MAKFKVGDTVKVVKDLSQEWVGLKGSVVYIDDNKNEWPIKLDIEGHGSELGFKEEELEVVKKACGSKFHVGDRVRCIGDGGSGAGWKKDLVYTITKVKEGHNRRHVYFGGYCGAGCHDEDIELLCRSEVVPDITTGVSKQKTKEDSKMNSNIIKLFPKTEDAVLVNSYFGESMTDLMGILAQGREKEILAFCKEKEAEKEKNK